MFVAAFSFPRLCQRRYQSQFLTCFLEGEQLFCDIPILRSILRRK